ncbi:Nucleoporin GLE1 [Phytophthora citrophthora]|uniref:mRNA export factor GLE1 n=1 Tax=Phytophthora citrophthora TaxID=4793 RepID=A0AAD9G3Q6_9STRA|nr:Nucleoporin GLE1 [Phytophthora citrophthora]
MRFGVALEDEAPGVYCDLQEVQKPRTVTSSCRRRFRAPSSDSSTSSSDGEDSDEALNDSKRSVDSAASALGMLQLTAKTRQDLVEQVERACERKAVQAVTGSGAYKQLCETLQRARQDAEAQLRHLGGNDRSMEEMGVLRKQQQLEREGEAKLQKIRKKERSALDQVETELRAFQQAREDERRREEEQKKREEEELRREEDAREKALQEAKEIEEAAEAQRKAEEEVEEAQAKAKALAAERALTQKKQQEEREKEQVAKRAAEKKAAAQAKKYVEDGHQCIKRLEELHRHTTDILDSPDPSVKKIRMQIRREAGACNQIAAAPSAIKNVVSKIQQLLQMAKTSGEAYFKFALDMVASNLSKQVEGRADYKSCYPIAHVIKMSCVQTPELTDVMLGYFYKTCVFTIPDNPEKHASQTIAEYKISVGFQKAVGESSDPDGLEHVTEYTRRMTMISAVLAAVRQTTPWDGSPSPPGLELGDCWTWLARLINEPPHLMTGALTLTILEVAGFELLRNYKKQFHKMLVLIARDVCPRLSKNAKTGAANAAGQLEMFVNQYHANRCTLNEPDGRKLEETKISSADEERTDRDDYGGGGGYRGGRGGGRGGRGGGRGGGRRR